MRMKFEDKAIISFEGFQYIRKEIVLQILLQAQKEELSYDCLMDSIINMKIYK